MRLDERLRDPKLWIALEIAIAALLVSRQQILNRLQVQLSDVPQYVEYSRDFAEASAAGQPFAAYHREAVYRRLSRAESPLPLSAAAWRSRIEYPPLGVSWLVFASAVLPHLTGDFRDDARYHRSYRVMMAIVDGLTFLVLTITTISILKCGCAVGLARRLLLYVLFGWLLGYFAYDRFDLLVGGVLLLSLALLVSRAHFAWSFVVLAAGINLKVVPIVLAPLWVLASLPASALARPMTQQSVVRLVAQAAGRGLWIAVPAGLFLLVGTHVTGGHPGDFLAFQASRGLEIGSFYASLGPARAVGGTERSDGSRVRRVGTHVASRYVARVRVAVGRADCAGPRVHIVLSDAHAGTERRRGRRQQACRGRRARPLRGLRHPRAHARHRHLQGILAAISAVARAAGSAARQPGQTHRRRLVGLRADLCSYDGHLALVVLVGHRSGCRVHGRGHPVGGTNAPRRRVAGRTQHDIRRNRLGHGPPYDGGG